MTEFELTDHLNYKREIKLYNEEPFVGVILRASEFERVNTKHIYIKESDLKEWDKYKNKKNKSEQIKYQIDVEPSEIESLRLIKE